MAIKGLRPRATAHGGSVTPGQDSGAFTWTPQQQRVLDIVSDGEGVAVIGAPGSGKSALLIELAVRGWRTVEQGDSTEQGVLLPPVLTLTAERRSATLLRRRVAAALPATTSGTPARSTQALAFELLTAHAVATGGPLPELLTGAEQDSIIADLLLGHLDEAPNDVDGRGPEWPTWLAAPVRMLQVFRTELRDLLDRADAASINSRELADMGSRHRRPEWLAAAAFADDYHDVLQTYRTERFSATELVLRAAELVRRDGLPGVSLVLADDLQDWSRADLALLDALASTGTPVAVFGDPDLASNSFRGGAADALGSGGTRWGVSVETVVLDSVFRHGSQIRDAIADLSYSLGAAGAGRQRKALASPSVSGPSAVGNSTVGTSTVGTSTVEGASLVSVTSADATGEVFAIARQLAEQHLLSDVAWSRMAVVVRSRGQVELMASRLGSQGVPTRTVASIVDVDDTAIGSDLLSVMRIASGAVPLDAELAARLLAGPLGGLDSVRLARLRSDLVTGEFVSGGTRSRSTQLVDALTSDDGLRDVRPDLARHARKLAGILRSATQAAESGADAEELLWMIWDGSGLAPGWQEQALLTGARADEANTNLDAVMALFTSARRFVEARPDSTVAVFLAEHDGSTVPVDSLGASVDVDRVLVCTPANVVGDSYEAVVVAGLQEGAWPNLAPRGTLLHATEFTELLDSQDGRAVRRSDAERRREVLDDELRLLILALSRAERIAVISAVSSDDAQPSRFFEHLALMAGTVIGPDDLGAAHHDLTHLVAALRAGLERRLATTTVSGEGVAEVPAEIPAEAIALARLAEAGIDAADPAKWYGMLPPSTDAPLAALGPDEQPFKVSPSTIEKFEKSPLIWFLDRVAPQYNGNSAAIGTMVHSVMENAGEDLSTAALWDALDERWSELEHDAEWLRERSRTEVRTMLTALSAYLVRFDRDAGELLGSEVPFTLDLGPVRLSGVIDRVESRKGKDGERRLQIVDLKTGARPASAAETVEHAQLSGYQLAAAEGLLGEAIDPDLTIGGASLLYIGSKNHTAGAPVSRDQPPLDADGVAGFTRRVRDVGAAMASGDFRVPVDLDERDPAAARVRSHLIPAASSAPVAPTERSGPVSADTAPVSAEDPV